MNKHTPGPLDIFGDGIITLENGTAHEVRVLTVKDAIGGDEEVAYCFDVERAAFIVRACNAHEELVEALKRLQSVVRDEYHLLDIRKRPSLCLADAQAGTAIAKANEGRA